MRLAGVVCFMAGLWDFSSCTMFTDLPVIAGFETCVAKWESKWYLLLLLGPGRNMCGGCSADLPR